MLGPNLVDSASARKYNTKQQCKSYANDTEYH